MIILLSEKNSHLQKYLTEHTCYILKSGVLFDYTIWKPNVFISDSSSIQEINNARKYSCIIYLLVENAADVCDIDVDYYIVNTEYNSTLNPHKIIKLTDYSKLNNVLLTHEVFKLKSDYVYIIGGAYRPHVLTFITRVEYEYFHPVTGNNELFEIFKADNNGTTYLVIGVPLEYLERCICVAKKCELKLVQGRPVERNFADAVVHFPFEHSADLVYTLENVKKIDLSETELKHMLLSEKIRVNKYIRHMLAE